MNMPGQKHTRDIAIVRFLGPWRNTRDLTIIRAPMDGKIIRRYANPGAGASTLNVSVMFDLAPAARHIIRAEIVESAIPDTSAWWRSWSRPMPRPS
jgi:hypothetical protein